jgi:polar amino acid transport system substrate-binding protein
MYGASPVGIAVPKDDIPLANLVAEAVNKLISEGSYQKLLDAWGNGAGAIKTAQVNPPVDK